MSPSCELSAFRPAPCAAACTVRPYKRTTEAVQRPLPRARRQAAWLDRRGGALPAGRPPPHLGRRLLRCTARLTSSRGSLDEEQQDSMPLPLAAPQQQGQQQALLTASTQQMPPPGQQQPPPPLPPQQDPEAEPQAKQAPSIKKLQLLTELHVEDSYACGVASSAAELAACLRTSTTDGLGESEAELAQRAQRYGSNNVRRPKETTFLELVQEALQDFTILILLAAGCTSLALELLINTGDEAGWIEGASILAAVVVVVLVSAVNNYQKERQFRALQEVSDDVKVRAIRNGRELELPVRDVLVGDLLLVETGDILCTDGVLVSACDVKVDESHLTGEPDDVSKDATCRASLLGGSKVLSGFGRMLVTSVGPNSQSGAIAEMVADGKAAGAGDGLREETLLQRKLTQYATTIGKFGLGAASLATVAMTLRFSLDTFVFQQSAWDWAYLQEYLHIFITGVTILVVAVPEGLPLAVTIALAFSVRRMLADNNLVRHLSAAETMGTATVICSDKTGTLTQNDMVISRLWLAGQLQADLKPYTRSQQKQQWKHGVRQAAGTGATSAGGISSGGSISDGGSMSSSSGSSSQTPLAELLTRRSPRSSSAGSMSGSDAAAATAATSSSPAGSSSSSTSEVAMAPEHVLQLLLESVSLNSTASIYTDVDGEERRIGNRTEIAMLELARLAGASPRRMRREHQQMAQVAFSSDRKRMTTAALLPQASSQDGGNGTVTSTSSTSGTSGGEGLCRIYTKGASELVLERCRYVLAADGSRRRLAEGEAQQLLADFTQGGQRVLCLAYRDITLPAAALRPSDPAPDGASNGSSSSNGSSVPAAVGSAGSDSWLWDAGSLNAVVSSASGKDSISWDESLSLADNLECNLTLLALVGIEDPLRTEVPAAIRQCQASGITVKMLTGDNAATATAIAQECGILPPAGASVDAWLAQHAAASGSDGTAGWYNEGHPGSSISIASGSIGSSSGISSMASLDAISSSGGSSGGSSGSTVLPPGVVMEGSEFRQRVLQPDGSINADEFLRLWPQLRVLARCTPADKYTIVTGVRSLTKDVVAVTGDGTNDAPALRAANVGFAMNVGTDTAKEAADIVLLDNNFASIVSAVLWGRNVYANITRFLQFQLTINLVAVATAVTGAVVASESPLTAVQMLWVNLIMDSLASLALATEPPDSRLLGIPPFSQEHEFVDPRTPTIKHILGQAAYQLVVMCGLIFYAPALLGIPDHSLVNGPSEHYTMVFNTFVFMQLFNQLNARKILDSSPWYEGLQNAKIFQGILAGELLLQVLIVQFGGRWFSTQPLDSKEWLVCIALAATTLGVREVLRKLPYGR